MFSIDLYMTKCQMSTACVPDLCNIILHVNVNVMRKVMQENENTPLKIPNLPP